MAGTNIHRDICGVCSRVQCVSRFSLVQRSRQRRPTIFRAFIGLACFGSEDRCNYADGLYFN